MRIQTKAEYDAAAKYYNRIDAYRLYLQTDHWKRIRIKTYEYYQHRCHWCHKELALMEVNVHHLKYKNKWCEVPGIDVILLCRDCHKHIHKIKPKKTLAERQAKLHRKVMKQRAAYSRRESKSKQMQRYLYKAYITDPACETIQRLLKDAEYPYPNSHMKYDPSKLNELIEMLPNKKDFILRLMKVER